MTQWFHDPFAQSTIRGSHSGSATLLQLQSGHGDRFPTAPRQLVIWDATLWEDWVEAFYNEPAAAVEIVHQLVAATPNALPSVLRAQAGTTALDMTDTTHEFRIQAVQTGFVVATDINTGTLTVSAGDLTIEDGNLVCDSSAWDGPHIVLDPYHIWVDGTGDLRIKSGAPSSDTDGTVVGTQS